MTGRRATGFLTQADVSRSVKAARAAGLDVTEIDIDWAAGHVRLKTRPAGTAAAIEDDPDYTGRKIVL